MSTPSNLQPGQPIGDWIIDGPLGAGGMGSVFRCHNALAPRILAAVKVVHPDPARDFAQRFVHEVEALESLQHPAVVRVKGWGEAQGMLWLAMDLVEGEDLRERLQRGPLPEPEAHRVFRELAAGLAHAHGREVFHRDIKPANVVLANDGTARIVDFGIAIHDGRTRLSSAGMVPGTPAYLAPEVFGGDPQPRALDVYAFGQLLYEALTGQQAFPEPAELTTTQAIAHVAGRKLQSAPLDPGPAISEPLRAIVRATTHPDPRRRLLDLDRVVAGFDGTPLPDLRASETMDFDVDTIEPVFDAVEPVLPPVPPATPARGLGPLLVLTAGGVGAAVLVGAILWGGVGGPRAIEVAITGLDHTVPTAVWVDGRALSMDQNVYRTTIDTQTASVVARAGRFCDLEKDTCAICCSCFELTSDRDSILVPMQEPAQPSVLVRLEPPPALQASVRLGSMPGSRTPDGAWEFAPVAPGSYALEATVGTCPASALGCDGDCPPGCNSIARPIEVTVCGENTFTIAIEPPEPLPVPLSTPQIPVASALRAKRVKLIHMRGERAVAERIEGLLRARGATVELQLMDYEHRSSFGRVIPFGPGNEAAAKELARLVAPLSTANLDRTAETELDLDVVLWVASTE